MKKWVRLWVLIWAAACIITACGGTDSTGSIENTGAPTTEGAQKQASESFATVDSFEEDVVVGDFEALGMEVTIPKDALGAGARVIVGKYQSDPAKNQSIKSLASQTIQLTIEGEQRRTSEPLLIKLKLDENAYKGLLEFEGFKGAHFSEETGWTFTAPKEVNVTEGYVVYEVFNNPLWGTAELTEEARKEAFIKEKALQQWGMSQIEDDVQQMTRDMIEAILVEKFNATNKSEIEAVAKAVLSELKYGNLEYGKLANDLMNKDFGSYTAYTTRCAGWPDKSKWMH